MSDSSIPAAARQLFEDGVALERAGRAMDAVASYDAAAVDAPLWWRPARAASSALLRLGLPAQAAYRIRTARDRGQRDVELLLEEARIQAAMGDARAAAKSFREVAAEWPQRPDLWLDVCQQLTRSKQYKKALTIADHVDASRLEPAAAAALLVERAKCLLATTRTIDAAAALIASVVTQTSRVDCVLPIANELSTRGRFRDALALVASVTPLVPAGLTVHHQRTTLALQRAEKLVEAVSGLESTGQRIRVTRAPITADLPIAQWEPLPRSDAPSVRRYFVIDSTLPSPRTPALPSSVAEAVASDFRWIGTDGAVAPAEQAVSVYDIANAFVFGNMDLDSRPAPVTTDGQFVHELVGPHSPMRLSLVAATPATRQISHHQTVFVVPAGGGTWTSHFHSIIEAMPALSLYTKLKLSCPIVLPGVASQTQRALMHASDIPPTTELLTVAAVKDVTFPRLLCPASNVGQQAATWLRQAGRRLEKQTNSPRSHDTVLYISRGRHGYRSLSNEQLLEEALAQTFNASCIHMQDFDLSEQISRIRSATVLVAPHGAGLANIAFAESGLWVVEMLSAGYRRLTYRRLSAICGHHYVPIVGPTLGNTQTWSVDIDKVLTVVGKVLDAASSSRHPDPH